MAGAFLHAFGGRFWGASGPPQVCEPEGGLGPSSAVHGSECPGRTSQTAPADSPLPRPTAPQPRAAACRPADGKVGSKAERSHGPQAHKETHLTRAPCLGPCPLGPCPALHPSARVVTGSSPI